MAFLTGTGGVLLIIGIILLIVGIILAIVYRSSLSSKWWIWVIIGLGILFGIIGLILGVTGVGTQAYTSFSKISAPEVDIFEAMRDYGAGPVVVGSTPVATINTMKL